MSTKLTLNEKALEIIAKARKSKKNIWQALEKACIPRFVGEQLLSQPKLEEPELVDDETEQVKFVEKDDDALLKSSGSIRTVDELLAAAKVDLTVWRVDTYEVTKWDVGRKAQHKDLTYTHGKVDGITKDSGGMNVKELFRVMIRLKRIKGVDEAKDLLNYFREELAKSINPKQWDNVDEVVPEVEKNYCLELAIPDLHLGKLAHGNETGWDNYDSGEAVRIFKEAAHDLVNKAPMDNVERILFVVGNDFFHSDNAKDETSGGTKMDVDSRWQKTFKKGCTLLREVISELGVNHMVDVLLVAGNHDLERNFYLGEYLSAVFENHPNVSVNNEPTMRKYYRYGSNLIGFTHGSYEKHNTLPLIMARERPQDWAETNFREIHVGHIHKEHTEEFQGVKVRFLPSLCGTDAWHSQQGYVGTLRSATAFLYHKDKGLEALYYFNL